MKILIADDDGVSRRILRATLLSLGHEVVEVADGESTVAALALPDAPALVILDWMMPGLDGLAVCRTVRQTPGRYIYLILLTVRDAPDDMIEALDAGADEFLTKPCKVAELRARLKAGERVLALQDELLRGQQALRHEATHDQLTGLWNRGRILDELSREVRRHRREMGSLAVIMADVDHFKSINDCHGHMVGDTVLKHIGRCLSSALRASDSVGRYGGEEFLVVLPRADDKGGSEVAERVRAAVAAQPFYVDGTTRLRVTLSLGIAWGGPHSLESAALVKAADDALYLAKANGRDRVETAGELAGSPDPPLANGVTD